MTEHHSSALEIFKKLVIFFFAGVAVFVGLVLFVYVLTLLFDKCCSLCPSSLQPSTSATMDDEGTDQGPVARKAGLWGLTIDERKLILRRLFQPILYREDTQATAVAAAAQEQNDDIDLEIITFSSDEGQSDNDNERIPNNEEGQQQLQQQQKLEQPSDIESQQDEKSNNPQPDGEINLKQESEVELQSRDTRTKENADEEIQIPTPSSADRNRRTTTLGAGQGDEDDEARHPDNAATAIATNHTSPISTSALSAVSDASQVVDNADLDHTCPICLREYLYGDTVVSGTGCSHLFHYECVMPWLEKHDHCPYCRNEMMTAFQMRHAAIEILGEERVSQMGPRTTITSAIHNDATTATTTNTRIDTSNTLLPNNTMGNAIRSASGRWFRRDDDDGY